MNKDLNARRHRSPRGLRLARPPQSLRAQIDIGDPVMNARAVEAGAFQDAVSHGGY